MEEPDEDDQPQQSQRAAAAARRGDAVGMIQALFAGGMADWLYWRTSKAYRVLPAQDIQDCVAEAISDTFQVLAAGGRIQALPGYLLKAARNNALDMLSKRRDERSADMDSLPSVGDPTIDALRASAHELLRRDALAKARALLPRLGMDNIRRVMEVIFDAIEQEIVDLRDSDIAAAVGLSEETAKRLKNRGFERLRRLAQDEGYELSQYERAVGLTEIVELGYDDEHDDDE